MLGTGMVLTQPASNIGPLSAGQRNTYRMAFRLQVDTGQFYVLTAFSYHGWLDIYDSILLDLIIYVQVNIFESSVMHSYCIK